MCFLTFYNWSVAGVIFLDNNDRILLSAINELISSCAGIVIHSRSFCFGKSKLIVGKRRIFPKPSHKDTNPFSVIDTFIALVNR